VNQVAFSPDGQRIVTASGDDTARVWRADGTGEPVVLKGHTSWVYQTAFSPDGSRILVASGNLWVHLFAVQRETDSQSLTIQPIACRLVPFGLWSGAFQFDEVNPGQLRVGLLVTGNGIKTADMRFDIADAPPLEGNPQELLETWQHKLALKFDQDGKIVPRWPVGEPIRTR